METTRFLNLVLETEVDVYRDIVIRPNQKASINLEDDNIYQHFTYYIFKDNLGLKKVTPSKRFPELIDILRYYNLDDKYLDQLNPNMRHRDIRTILFNYEIWKLKYTPRGILS